MKIAAFIFSLTGPMMFFGQGLKFELKFSEPLAIFVYVEQLSAREGDNAFKRQFVTSTYNKNKHKSLLLQFDSLRLNYHYDFDQYPYASKLPGSTESLLKKCLVGSTNLKDFKQKAIGILPNADLLILSAILYEFQQVYRDLVYQPVKTKFDKQLKELNEFVKSKNLAGFVDKGLLFYKSYWDESVPIEIALYPLPSPEGIRAEAFYNAATCGMRSDSRDYARLMSILLHEVCHMLYNEEPVQTKQKLYDWFMASTSPCKTYAYLLFNEALATALGNGHVFASLTGKTDEDDWYDQKYINDMARKIYPVLSDYLAQKKSIDEAFVTNYIQIYETQFPNWINELNHVLCYRYVLSEKASDLDVIRKKYRYAYYHQSEDQLNEQSLSRLKASLLTKLIVVSQNNEAKLKLIKAQFPELATWKYKAKQEFIYAVQLQDKSQLLIVNSVQNGLEKMLEGMVLVPQQAQKK